MAIREPRRRKKPDAPQWDGTLYGPVKFGDDAQTGRVEGEQNRRRELLTEREYRAQVKRLEERDALYPAERRDEWPMSSPHFWPFRRLSRGWVTQEG